MGGTGPQNDDVLVVDSLFVSPTEVSLQGLLLCHRVHQAAATMMVKYSTEDDNGECTSKEYVAIRSDGLVATYAPAGTSKSSDVKVSAVALHRESRLKVQKDITDMRMYVFNKKALSVALEENVGLIDIQRHLIPYFVRRNLAERHASKIDTAGGLLERMGSHTLSGSEAKEEDSVRLQSGQTVHAYFLGNDDRGKSKHGRGDSRELSIIDSDGSYANANRDILKNLQSTIIAEGVTMGNKAVAGNGSIVGAHSKLGDRSSIKRSVVGASCIIGANAKIINCIVHDGVSIGDGCHVQNSIVGRHATLHDKTTLKDCIVGANQRIQGGNHKGEEYFEE